jgi:hypothetical protein
MYVYECVLVCCVSVCACESVCVCAWDIHCLEVSVCTHDDKYAHMHTQYTCIHSHTQTHTHIGCVRPRIHDWHSLKLPLPRQERPAGVQNVSAESVEAKGGAPEGMCVCVCVYTCVCMCVYESE